MYSENSNKDFDNEIDESKLQICRFCGDVFIANSPERMYCPEKYGKKNYCKQEQKKLVQEAKLAELVEQLTDGGIILKPGESSFDRSIRGLQALMGNETIMHVSGERLEQFHINIQDLQGRTIDDDKKPVIIIGNYRITWLEHKDNIFKFKITYHEHQ